MKTVRWSLGSNVALMFLLVPITIGLAVSACVSPTLTLSGAVAIMVLVLAFWFPEFSVWAVLAVSGFELLATALKIDVSILSTTSFAVAIVGLLGTLRPKQSKISRNTKRILAATIIITVLGTVVSQYTIGPLQAIQGVRLFVTPIFVALIASTLSAAAGARLMRLGTLIVALSAVAAIFEGLIGISGLVQRGFAYGTTVRSYEGQLRAPGLFATNYALGAFAGIMGALAITWWPTLEPGRAGNRLRVVAILASITCLITSTYRTGLLVFFLAIGIWIVTDRARSNFIRRFILIVGSVALFVYILLSGLLRTDSLGERVTLWQNLFAQHSFQILGNGFGYSGAASASRFATRRIVVDNYFINLTLQLGVVSLIIFVVLIWLSFSLIRRSTHDRIFSSGATLLATIAAFALVDYWEYTAAMSLILAAVGMSRSNFTKELSPNNRPHENHYRR